MRPRHKAAENGDVVDGDEHRRVIASMRPRHKAAENATATVALICSRWTLQ